MPETKHTCEDDYAVTVGERRMCRHEEKLLNLIQELIEAQARSQMAEKELKDKEQQVFSLESNLREICEGRDYGAGLMEFGDKYPRFNPPTKGEMDSQFTKLHWQHLLVMAALVVIIGLVIL